MILEFNTMTRSEPSKIRMIMATSKVVEVETDLACICSGGGEVSQILL